MSFDSENYIVTVGVYSADTADKICNLFMDSIWHLHLHFQLNGCKSVVNEHQYLYFVVAFFFSYLTVIGNRKH